MERKQYGINCFRWPAVPDIEVYHRDDLLLQIKAVTPVHTEILSSTEIVFLMEQTLQTTPSKSPSWRIIMYIVDLW